MSKDKELKNKEADLKGSAGKKTITLKLALGLISVGKQKGNLYQKPRLMEHIPLPKLNILFR
jgi:hypothetical protein